VTRRDKLLYSFFTTYMQAFCCDLSQLELRFYDREIVGQIGDSKSIKPGRAPKAERRRCGPEDDPRLVKGRRALLEGNRLGIASRRLIGTMRWGADFPTLNFCGFRASS